MTLDTVVETLHARRTSPGKFLARCPAHPDRSPSLSITSGRDGRVLLRCFAGCTVESILSASGLALRDLFAGPPLTRDQLLANEKLRSAAESLRRQRGTAEREYVSGLRQGYRERDSAVRRVARKLALMADTDDGAATMTVLLHDLIAERRSFDRAIVDDPEDYLPLEKPVPSKPRCTEVTS